MAGIPSMQHSFYNLNCMRPDQGDLSGCMGARRSNCLRIAVDAFFWLIVAIPQILWKTWWSNQLGRNKPQQFVDMLALTNISVFLLPSKYSGFYIHGQTPLAHADTSLPEFSALLEGEGSMLKSSRGLLTEHEQQEFIITLSLEEFEGWHSFAETVREEKERSDDASSSHCYDQVGPRTIIPSSEQLIEMEAEVSENLRQFIRKMQTDNRDSVKEITFKERFLNIPPENVDGAEFNPDSHQTWLTMTYQGIEFDLLLFDIYIFTLADIIIGNPIAAMLLTFMCQKGLDYLRYHIGVKNIGYKTLIGQKWFV